MIAKTRCEEKRKRTKRDYGKKSCKEAPIYFKIGCAEGLTRTKRDHGKNVRKISQFVQKLAVRQKVLLQIRNKRKKRYGEILPATLGRLNRLVFLILVASLNSVD